GDRSSCAAPCEEVEDLAPPAIEQPAAERRAERLGLAQRALDAIAHAARAVGQADESLQRERAAVGMREAPERHLAAALDDEAERALGARRAGGLRILEGCEQRGDVGAVAPIFDREDALADGGQRERLRKRRADARLEAEAAQPRRGEDDRVVLAGVELGEARVHVAAQRPEAKPREGVAQLALAPQARGADERARGHRIER